MSKPKIYETGDVVGAGFMFSFISLVGILFVKLVIPNIAWYWTTLICVVLVELTIIIYKTRLIHSDSKMADAWFTKMVLLCIYLGTFAITGFLMQNLLIVLKIIGGTIAFAGAVATLVGIIYLNSLLYKDKENKNERRKKR